MIIKILELFFCSLILSINSQKIINISDYEYPSPDDSGDIYYVPLLSINDIHGTYFPTKIQLNNGSYYLSGGLDYLGKYISLMKNEWKDRFLWFDVGDDFQGGLESKLSNGSLITDFFNIMGASASTFGNHEWDYGKDYLYTRLNNSKFPYLACNLYNKKTREKVFLPNQLEYKIYEIEQKVSIGVIGLSNKLDKPSGKGFEDIQFLDYYPDLIKTAELLREYKVNAIVVIAHVGLFCDNDEYKKLKLQIYTKETKQQKCNEECDVYKLLKKVKEYNPNLIDAFITGHSHDQNHHWVNDFPVMSNINFAKYSSILYLPFNKSNNYQIIKDKIQIEGPIPLCEKIFEKTLRCDEMNNEEIAKSGELSNYSFHNIAIEKENKLKNLSDYWFDILDKFQKDKVTYLVGQLVISQHQESGLGNLYGDFLRAVTGADISILNIGTFRKIWSTGYLTVSDFYSMTPFDNTIFSFEITGYDLKKMISQLQTHKREFYVISGIKQIAKQHPFRKLLKFNLFDGFQEVNIEENKFYRISTIEYLFHGGGKFEQVLKWMKNIQNIIEYRDIKEEAVDYFRNIKVIYADNLIDENNPRLRYVD